MSFVVPILTYPSLFAAVFKGASGPTVAAGVVGAGLVAYAAMGSSKTAIYPPEEKMNKPLPKDVTVCYARDARPGYCSQ